MSAITAELLLETYPTITRSLADRIVAYAERRAAGDDSWDACRRLGISERTGGRYERFIKPLTGAAS